MVVVSWVETLSPSPIGAVMVRQTVYPGNRCPQDHPWALGQQRTVLDADGEMALAVYERTMIM
jgi:hypothetical protein